MAHAHHHLDEVGGLAPVFGELFFDTIAVGPQRLQRLGEGGIPVLAELAHQIIPQGQLLDVTEHVLVRFNSIQVVLLAVEPGGLIGPAADVVVIGAAALSNILDNPTVSAIGTRELGESGNEHVFGLAIRWPIPFWNQNRGAIREAKAELTKREVEYDAFKREVGRDVVSAVAETQLAQRQVTTWKTGVDQANDLARLASQQYRDGDINFITYLEHLATVRETKVAYVEALATYRTQLARLNQAVASTLMPERKEVR